ncbi:MAG: group II intron reverse transcriptase/maturase [Actinobacteria bacterium]|nr:group II intron reverse transcriptase/maturase [Actinomycetota bacterium]
MNDRGKSDDPVVPAKLANNAQGRAAESVEERGSAEGNVASETRSGPRAGSSALSDLACVRRAAQTDKEARFTALLHHVDVDRLRAAYWATRPKAAPGVDGVTWRDYGSDLEENLRDLHDRVHAGRYRARPSRRVFIPKADGRLRPLGVAALEDKIVQRALVEVLNAIYEQDFLGFSYGFRTGRSPHHALDALSVGIVRKKVNWVLDADFREFFTSLDHRWLERFLEHRIADRRVLRLIQKWMAAGVIEDGAWTASEEGVPQGASASPLLANVYLHYVFDLWAHQWRTRHAHGDVVIVRFADDFVVGFEHRDDADRFWADLRERLAKFSLELNAEKTRLIQFGRFAAMNRAERGLGKPETFQFLGFTHLCATSKNGRFKLKRTTDSKRMRAKLSKVKAELMRRRDLPIPDQGRWLASVLRGHFNYYAVPDNGAAISAFRYRIIGHWLRALRRRSQRHRMTWQRIGRLADRWLPPARIRGCPRSRRTLSGGPPAPSTAAGSVLGE